MLQIIYRATFTKRCGLKLVRLMLSVWPVFCATLHTSSALPRRVSYHNCQ